MVFNLLSISVYRRYYSFAIGSIDRVAVYTKSLLSIQYRHRQHQWGIDDEIVRNMFTVYLFYYKLIDWKSEPLADKDIR